MATVERTRGGRAVAEGTGDPRPAEAARRPAPLSARRPAVAPARSPAVAAARPRFASRLALACAIGLASLVSGCRVDQNDLHRWETTSQGPRKLCAVLVHDKYDVSLRVEAALALIRMKPRSGRRPGFNQIDPDGDLEPCRRTFVDALGSVSTETRQAIVGGLVPQIIGELQKPPPVAQAGQPSPPDPSFPYKDAAYAMLTFERVQIVADDTLRQNLRNALAEWAIADFEHRLDNRTQLFGMEQLLRHLGPPSVVGLPKLMTRDSRRLDQMASLVAELGDPKTKEAASTALVGIAKYIASDEWMKIKKPELEAANAASKLQPTPDQFQMQLITYQGEELMRAFGSIKKVGGRPAVEYCLGFAADKGPDPGKRPEAADAKADKEAKEKAATAQALWDLQREQIEKRRQAALAALEGRLDRNNADDIKRIFALATSDAPDSVLDLAFRRISEMPREVVADKLYELFKGDKWKIRRIAAATILKMSSVKHIDEFMGKLPADGKNFAMAEAITYGALFGDLKEGDLREALKKHLSSGPAVARTTALSYYLTLGNKTQVDDLKGLDSDSTSAPTCDIEPDCRWVCEVPKEGAKDPKERELKDIKTVGEYVKHCVVPTMLDRSPEPKKDEPKKDEPKQEGPKQDEPKKDEPKKDEKK